MSMVRQDALTKPTPFHSFICDGCGKPLGQHWLFRPDKMADVHVGPNARRPDGILYCNRDGLGRALSYHQRELKRTMEPGFA